MAEPSGVFITELSTILILPLRLDLHDGLKKLRESPKASSTQWLDAVVCWLSKQAAPNAEPAWKPSPNLYSTLALLQGTGGGLETAGADRYAVAVYFHPFVRNLFFSKDPSIKVLEHTQIRGATVQAEGDGLKRPVRHFRVRRLHLFLFPSDVCIVTVQLDWEKAADESPMPLGEGQDLLNQLRRLYAPYYSGTVPGQTPARMRWWRDAACKQTWGEASNFETSHHFIDHVSEYRAPPLAAHWVSLLAPLTQTLERESKGKSKGKSAATISQILDERVPVMAFVALDPITHLTDGDLARLLFLESHGNPQASPYSPDFLGDLKKYVYNRYWEPQPPERFTTRFLCCDYNFLIAVSSADQFALNKLRRHFERHYFFLGLLAWMQKASLLHFWNRLADIVHRYSIGQPGTKSRDEFFRQQKWLTDDFSDFVTRFYFSEVSNQIQALELFQWWSGHLRIAELYQQVLDQTKFLREVHLNHWQERTQLWQGRLQQVAVYWLPISLALAFLSIFSSNNIWKIWHDWDFSSFWLTVACALVISAFLGSLIWLAHFRKKL